MRLRRARLADCAAIARMHRQTIRAVNSKDYSPEIIQSWSGRTSAKKFRDTHDKCIRYVVVENNVIIGFGDIMKADGNLGGIYIHKDWIGKGVGTMLIETLESEAIKLGAKMFRFSASITAKPFYESKGYTLAKPRKIVHRYVNGEPMYVYAMEKVLDPKLAKPLRLSSPPK